MDDIIFTKEANTVLRNVLKTYVPEQIYFLTDSNTYAHCLSFFAFSDLEKEHILTIGAGESYKSLESVAYIWSKLTQQGARRSAVLVNIGGGLVTDLGGFAASCFKRGIKCIHIPTTLLSQVDASVGGKTGINFEGLKNEIGTFSKPAAVIIDSCFLKTLPSAQLLSGFAEMLKHALLAGGEHWERIQAFDPHCPDWDELTELIRESVGVKERIVLQDPKETGLRKALNFGHTAGHAIESAAIAHHAGCSHGTAVAYGMVAELYLSVLERNFDREAYVRIRKYIWRLYPPYVPVVGEEELYALMLHDKKNERDGVNFTLLCRPGEFVVDNYCSHEKIIEALKQLREE